MTLPLERFDGDSNVGLGRVGPVFLNVWFSVPSVASLRLWLRVLTGAVRQSMSDSTTMVPVSVGRIPP